MSKRLKFERGAGEYIDRGVVFELNGPGQEVEDDRAEVLESLADYDFAEESDEEYQERVAAAKKLEDEEAAAAAAAEKYNEAADEVASATNSFYHSYSVAEQQAAGVADESASVPATDNGDANTAPPVEAEPEVEPDADSNEDSGTETRSRFPK